MRQPPVNKDNDNDLPWDYHVETCVRDGFLARRHHDFQTAIRQLAASLGQPSQLTASLDGSGLEADALFHQIPGRNGHVAVIVDFSICHHFFF